MKKLLILFLLLSLPAISVAETIAEIFPDPNVARYVRDEIGAISIDDEVMQDQLDSIWIFGNFDGYGEIKDISGVSRLGGVSMIRLSCVWGSDVLIETLPDELFTMANVDSLDFYYLPGLKSIPDEIGNLEKLWYISFEKCGITSLPDSICDLTNLTTLDISGCPITKLPDNIGNLVNLKRLDISDTLITELPESIKNLTNLENFDRSGTPL